MSNPEEKYVQFNLNYNIKVKLKEAGYLLLASQWNNMAIMWPNTFDKKCIADFEKEADSEGYTTMQAWVFMEKFGSITGNGMAEHYDLEILIPSSKLTDPGEE